MKKSEKKLIKRMQKQIGSGEFSHYCLWTGEPGRGFILTGAMEENALVAAAMSLFGTMSEHERRVTHLLMAHSMENSPEEVWAETREGYV